MSNVVSIDIDQAAKEILKGNLVAFPTETVYGLGANIENESAVLKIYKAKERPLNNPVIAHVSGISMASRYLKDKPCHIMQLMMGQFWPGPLTIVSEANMNIVPKIVTANTQTIGIRCPDHPVAIQLITQCKVGIAAPSANISGHVSPTNPDHVIDDYKHKSIPVKVINNIKYQCKQNIFGGIESTIIRLEGKKILPTNIIFLNSKNRKLNLLIPKKEFEILFKYINDPRNFSFLI